MYKYVIATNDKDLCSQLRVGASAFLSANADRENFVNFMFSDNKNWSRVYPPKHFQLGHRILPVQSLQMPVYGIPVPPLPGDAAQERCYTQPGGQAPAIKEEVFQGERLEAFPFRKVVSAACSNPADRLELPRYIPSDISNLQTSATTTKCSTPKKGHVLDLPQKWNTSDATADSFLYEKTDQTPVPRKKYSLNDIKKIAEPKPSCSALLDTTQEIPRVKGFCKRPIRRRKSMGLKSLLQKRKQKLHRSQQTVSIKHERKEAVLLLHRCDEKKRNRSPSPGPSTRVTVPKKTRKAFNFPLIHFEAKEVNEPRYEEPETETDESYVDSFINNSTTD